MVKCLPGMFWGSGKHSPLILPGTHKIPTTHSLLILRWFVSVFVHWDSSGCGDEFRYPDLGGNRVLGAHETPISNQHDTNWILTEDVTQEMLNNTVNDSEGWLTFGGGYFVDTDAVPNDWNDCNEKTSAVVAINPSTDERVWREWIESD
jgi:hypothetical protein